MRASISIILFFLFNTSFAQNITVSGYVTDLNTGEKLIDATVYNETTKDVVLTNNYGFYSMKIPKNSNVTISVSYVGFLSINKTFKINSNKHIDFELQYDNELEEVILIATKEKPIEKRAEMSVISIPIKEIKNLPAIGGESDIIKSLQLMPGVQSGVEGSSQLHVRGGSPDQNLMLLDDVPLYYVSHLGGFVSTFNTDAINSVKLIKGGFPAKYGNRLSSIVDVRMKEGNAKKFGGNVMVGMIASKISIEGPIKKDTTSYIISARRMLYDIISRAVSSISSKGKLIQGYHFYDINAKINHKFSDKNHIYLSAYLGNDNNYFKTKDNERDVNEINETTDKINWGNNLIAFRWNHLFSQRLFSNTTLSYTRYRFSYINEFKEVEENQETKRISKFNSGIYDANAKIDFEFYATKNYHLNFGVSATHHTFNPGVLSYKIKESEQVKDTVFGSIKLKAVETAAYVENKFELGKRLSVNLGLRYNRYQVSNKDYESFEPRALANFLITDDMSIKASYAEMQQNIHLLTTSGVGMPIDLWVPSTEEVAPQRSKQWALGLSKTLNKEYELSIESYYKELGNLISYKEGATYFSSSNDWQEKIETKGKGISFGVELLARKKYGKTTGWLGYTWAKSTRQFSNINFGKTYPYRYDRRHDFSVVANHKLRDNIDISATWVFGTGTAITLATSKYNIINTPTSGFTETEWTSNFSEVRYYGGKNAFRMRNFHKLDIGIRFHKELEHGTRTWNLSIYNVYNRQNPFYYFYENHGDYDEQGHFIEGSVRLRLKQKSLFPFIPSVSYSYKF